MAGAHKGDHVGTVNTDGVCEEKVPVSLLGSLGGQGGEATRGGALFSPTYFKKCGESASTE